MRLKRQSSSELPAMACLSARHVLLLFLSGGVLVYLAPKVYSIRQHSSAYVSICQHTSAYVGIRQHTSAYVVTLSVCRPVCVVVPDLAEVEVGAREGFRSFTSMLDSNTFAS